MYGPVERWEAGRPCIIYSGVEKAVADDGRCVTETMKDMADDVQLAANGVKDMADSVKVFG